MAAAAGILRCTLNRHAAIRDESNDDERDGGIRNCGRRHIAGLLMTRLQNRRASRRSWRDDLSSDGGNYTGADGRSISS